MLAYILINIQEERVQEIVEEMPIDEIRKMKKSQNNFIFILQ